MHGNAGKSSGENGSVKTTTDWLQMCLMGGVDGEHRLVRRLSSEKRREQDFTRQSYRYRRWRPNKNESRLLNKTWKTQMAVTS